MKYDYRKDKGLLRRSLLCAVFLTLHASLFTTPVKAQGMVTEIKVVAIHYAKDLDDFASEYEGASGNDKLDKDFRKGRGGGYVFSVFKKSRDKSNYITAVKVTADRGTEYGLKFTEGDKEYTPAVVHQEMGEHYDKSYRGGLNGRNYGIYGGAYYKQPHVYVSRSKNNSFDEKVLESAYVATSKPKNLKSNQTSSGGHAGGGRYFVFTWHSHQSQYKPYITDEAPTGSITKHVRYCDPDNCGIEELQDHEFEQRYDRDIWGQLPKSNPKSAESHYKKCKKCGQIVYSSHQFATYVSDYENHTKRCLACDYVEDAGHVNFGKQKLPVDEYHHIIYCDSCGFLKKFPHDYTYNRSVEREECERTIVKYTCSQCYHHALFEEDGIGHAYDVYGICTREGCLHPFERAAVEPYNGSDSIFVVKNFGNLYWVADHVNNRHPKTNIRLDVDLVADEIVELPWEPIGRTDSTAFLGTFDGGGHIISMLKTEEPQAGYNNRGLFGAIGKGATVKDVTLAACNIRGWDNIGALAGTNEGTISGCHVVFTTLSSIGSGMHVGGICGLNRGTITGCTTENSVWVGGVKDYAGGICGVNEGGKLSGNAFAAICGNGSDAVLPEAASEQ